MAIGITNISVDLIKQTIGESSNDVGTLCKSGNINKWSKRKPFRSSNLFHAGDAALIADLQSKNYGVSVVSYRDNPVTACGDEYAIELPRGEATYQHGAEPYRLGDFRGYEHLAVPPVAAFANVTVEIDYETATFMLAVAFVSDYNLRMSDLPVISGYYFAIIFSKEDWNTVYIISATSTIAQGGTSLSMPKHAPFNIGGSWAIRAVAVNMQVGTTPVLVSSLANRIYIALPFDSSSDNNATFRIHKTAERLEIIVSPVMDRTGNITSVGIIARYKDGGDLSTDLTVGFAGIQIDTGSGYVGYISSEASDLTIEAGQNSVLWSAPASSFVGLPTLVSGNKIKGSMAIPPAWRSLTDYDEYIVL